MDEKKLNPRQRARRKSRRVLRQARAHLSNPDTGMARILAAYRELQSQGQMDWTLPEA